MDHLIERPMTRRKFLKITVVAGVALTLGGGLIRELIRTAGLQVIRETRTQMGTLVNISVVHPDPRMGRQMVASTFAEMERLENILSRHRDSTPIAQLNRDGVLHQAPSEAVHLVKRSLEYSELTDGAFDITVKPLLDLYTSSFAGKGKPPPEREVHQARSLVGYRNVLLHDTTIYLRKQGMSITLDGIAKGYIVDRAVQALKEYGAEHVLVDSGGDMRSTGNGPGGRGWSIAVQDPRETDDYLATVRLEGQSIATSGDYLQYFTEDRRFNHILDPRTGRSPVHTSAATIVASEATVADALSTAVFVLGPEAGLGVVNELEGVEGMIVSKDGSVHRSKGLDRYTVGTG